MTVSVTTDVEEERVDKAAPEGAILAKLAAFAKLGTERHQAVDAILIPGSLRVDASLAPNMMLMGTAWPVREP